ncbi:MAG: response regulator transcription factor [Lachnospiraceae bacterium]|nr:response regulator transcription factor [Lachnospiraceae bacterium]
MIKVLIADDQQLIRESLKIVLNSVDGIEVIDTVGDGEEALASVKKLMPDVILMDVRMPKMDGVQCTRHIKEEFPEVRVIILTTFDDDEFVYDAIKYGASGYLLKGISPDELADAINTVYQGQAMLNPDVAAKVLKFFSMATHEQETIHVEEEFIGELNDNEWRIINEVARGRSNKEISEILNFSLGTVRNYLSGILEKLELRDRTQLAIWALQRRTVH